MLIYREKTKHYIWNAVVLVSTTFMAMYLPLDLQFDLSGHPFLNIGYWIASIVFAADLIFNFQKFKNQKESGTTDKSWTSYLSTWFLVDLLAAIPMLFCFGAGFHQLFRLVKLFRVGQFMHEFRQTELRFSIWMLLMSFVFLTLMMVHGFCFGWMAIYGTDQQATDTTNYISSLYWVVTTLTSVGYGDIVPVTNAQRLFGMVVQLCGIGLFGLIVGNVASIVSRRDAVKVRHEENLDLLTTAIRRRGLSSDLQKRILNYYTYLRDEKMSYDESSFLDSLPGSLRTEVGLHLKREFIEGIPLFAKSSEAFISEIAMHLEYIMTTPGDFIFRAGDPGDEMFFVISGQLEVVKGEDSHRLAVLEKGDFFGEIALFSSEPRTAGVRSLSYCNLYKLERDLFDRVITRFPTIANEILAMAKERMQKND